MAAKGGASASDINVIAELELAGIDYKWAGEGELTVLCPFHDDHTPNCGISVEKRVFNCRSPQCKKHGDFITFLAGFHKKTRQEVVLDLGTRYVLEEIKIISPDVVERWHAAIWEATPFLKALHDRGVTDELIRKYRIGCVTEGHKRISIPITNEAGKYVNIRKYLPGAPKGIAKMVNVRGHGRERLWPMDQLAYDKILICGGELKAIVAAEQLNRYGIGCVTATGGEGNWNASFLPLIASKIVFICYDIDDAGKEATQQRLMQIHRSCSQCYPIFLPLNIEEFPKGDISDFVAEGGKLYPLIEAAEAGEPWKPPVIDEVIDEVPCKMPLEDAIHAQNIGRRIEFTGVVTVKDDAPYAIPSSVKVLCDRAQRECAMCAVFAANKDKFKIHPEHPSILAMIGAPNRDQRESMMRAVGVPITCRSFHYVAEMNHNCEDLIVSPELEITSRTANRASVPTVAIGKCIEMNESYKMVGRLFPHPKTQKQTLLVSSYEPTQDALSTYKVRNVDELRRFSPDRWDEASIRDKINHIYSDFEANVTHIYRRQALHLAVDLAYHSPLMFEFDGRIIKGTVETCILGDSGQGKTDTVLGLQRHYNLGHRIEGKNSTVPGLLGGCQSLNGRWLVSWGVFPQHDRRLLIIEELKGMPIEVVSKLTDMRSYGFAEIVKIVARKTQARVRLVVTSNPRKAMKIGSYNFGIEAIRELMGSLEDVRRFDYATIVAGSEVPKDELNKLKSYRPYVEHIYNSELSRQLVLWAWTRRETDIVFEDSAISAILAAATGLCKEFCEDIPLVDSGGMRYKVARLAASIAARTFSADETGERLIVRAGHVDYIRQFLLESYGNPIFGYREYTIATSEADELIDPHALTIQLNAMGNGKAMVLNLLQTAEIDVTDFENWCGWNIEQAKSFLSFLVKRRALRRDKNRGYRKTPDFVTWLKTARDSPDMIKDAPDYTSSVPSNFG